MCDCAEYALYARYTSLFRCFYSAHLLMWFAIALLSCFPWPADFLDVFSLDTISARN